MLFAVDTNPLIDWAEGHDDIRDCFEIIKDKRRDVIILVPPTVLHELGHFYVTNKKGLGATALRARWN
jgi:predicted nucleic acid-binding protein